MLYDHQTVEDKIKKYWQEENTYKVEIDLDKPKYYVLDMFPYPSGAGLHVGHPLGYIASDIFSRYKRQSGFNVLHPMGYDAFGLPAEQYAIKTGVHPEDSTNKNIATYRKQLDNIGFNYDWSREVRTCDPNYYKWTQWIFLKLFDSYFDTKEKKAKPIADLVSQFTAQGTEGHTGFTEDKHNFSAEDWSTMSEVERQGILMSFRLAYRKESYVNWCAALGTVLANDEVVNGVSERGGHPVTKKAMLQWSLRITAYAERLLEGLNKLDWSESLKTIQRNWIGKSSGAELRFKVDGHSEELEVFTTRPDTIYGVTYMVLAPEHDAVSRIATAEQKDQVVAYQQSAAAKSDIDRQSDQKTVSGVFTGAYAIHPFTGSNIPIWISDYVLKDYGTGAIMAVPAEDARDNRFALHFDLPIVEILDKTGHDDAKIGDKVGVMQNSDFLNGMKIKDAINEAIKRIYDKGIGSKKQNYKLRDANYSRQRYWGEPFPIVYNEEGIAQSIPLDELPLVLPELADYQPTSEGRSPLAKVEDWVSSTHGIRETDTMPGFAGSSWYFLRYMDSQNDEAFASKEALEYWQDVDLYIGGTEHAVGHLMYSRFWHKVLFDLGYLPTEEPFKRLINQGMIQGVIESIYLHNDKEDGYHKFMCSKMAELSGIDNFVQIPVHIDYVSEYGSQDSYLSSQGIKSFIDWMPEYADAIFECSQGKFHKGTFTSTSGEDSILYTKSEVGKMSKSKYNVINPDDIIAKYGADCFRMYEMFLGPIEQSKPWDTNGIEGVSKFIKKFWSLYFDGDQIRVDSSAATKAQLSILHKTIKKVRKDIEQFQFNTCISTFMIAVNDLKKENTVSKEVLQPLVELLAPFAPFLSEYIYQQIGMSSSVHHSNYPEFDAAQLVADNVVYPVCINGKKRADLEAAPSVPKDELEKMARELPAIEKWLSESEVQKVIIVPARMINFVVKSG